MDIALVKISFLLTLSEAQVKICKENIFRPQAYLAHLQDFMIVKGKFYYPVERKLHGSVWGKFQQMGYAKSKEMNK